MEPTHGTGEPTPGALVKHADEVFSRVSPYPGMGLYNHCQRLYRFARMLLHHGGIEMPDDTAYFIAMVHDLGLVSERDQGQNYLQRSAALFRRETTGHGLGVDLDVAEQCLVYNHRLLPVPDLHPAAECFRRAVMIEHARGLRRYGLDRGRVARVYERFPRENFDRVLVDFTWRVVRHEPLTMVSGIFF